MVVCMVLATLPVNHVAGKVAKTKTKQLKLKSKIGKFKRYSFCNGSNGEQSPQKEATATSGDSTNADHPILAAAP